MRSRLWFIGLFWLFPLLLPGAVSAASGPVSVSELDFWLRGGRATGEILAEVKQRGLLEPVDADAQRRLRANGADAALLAQLGNSSLVVSADAAARARQEAAVLAEKDRANRALALQQLRMSSGNAGDGSASPNGKAGEASSSPGAGNAITPKSEITAFPEPSGGVDGWRVGYVNACRQAQAEHRMVFVYFTGSDWSDACQRTEQTVFGNAQFKTYAAQKLVLVRVDFPQRAIQHREVKEQNAKLAEAFGVTTYPSAFLLNDQGRPLAKLTSDLSTALALVTKLRTIETKVQAQ